MPEEVDDIVCLILQGNTETTTTTTKSTTTTTTIPPTTDKQVKEEKRILGGEEKMIRFTVAPVPKAELEKKKYRRLSEIMKSNGLPKIDEDEIYSTCSSSTLTFSPLSSIATPIATSTTTTIATTTTTKKVTRKRSNTL